MSCVSIPNSSIHLLNMIIYFQIKLKLLFWTLYQVKIIFNFSVHCAYMGMMNITELLMMP
jgi:hypothetical protein